MRAFPMSRRLAAELSGTFWLAIAAALTVYLTLTPRAAIRCSRPS